MKRTVASVLSLLLLAACEGVPQDPAAGEIVSVELAAARTEAAEEPIDRIMAAVNLQLEAQEAPYRLTGVEMFTIGRGRPANRILQQSRRWVPGDARRSAQSTGTEDVTYVLDLSDLTGDQPAASVEAAMVSSFDTWSGVKTSFLDFVRVADDGLNHDFLDAVPADPLVTCATSPFPAIFDVTALAPNADVIVGGWLPREYFDCLVPDPAGPGGDFILGVTWTFSFGTDANNDGYVDTALKEQYYNEAFDWVTSGASFLNFALIDIESVAVHENGHAADLGHFGGPPPPLRLHPNGRIFSPEAVMNPAYAGGEKRSLLPIDEAGYHTLWADGVGRQ